MVFASFGLTVSAADDDTNLVNSDLRLWSSSENVDVVKQSSGLFYMRTNGSSLSGKYLLVGSVFDASKVKSGDSFSINFYLPKYEETGFTWTEDRYFSQFNSSNGSFFVGLAYLDSQGSPVFYDNYYDELNEEDFRQYAGKEYTYTFTVDKISGTPYVMLAYIGTSSSSVGYVSLGSVSFVNNDEAEEEGFFSRLFEWFGEKFEDFKTSLSLIVDSFTILKDFVGEKISGIGDKLADVWSSIKSGFSDSVENVTNNFTTLGSDLTGKFDSVGTWFSDLKDSIVSKFQAIGDAITSKLKDVGESITTKFQEIGDKFTDFFDKFKPRVYETFSWSDGWIDNNGKLYSNYDWTTGDRGYSVVCDFFEVPVGTSYVYDFSRSTSYRLQIFRYSLSGEFIDSLSYTSQVSEIELTSGYQYRFQLYYQTSYPSEDLLSDVCNSEFYVYADEGWINALIHKLQSVIKNLFVPDDAFISEWKGNLEALCAEHLGIMYTATTFISEFISGVFDIVFEAPDTYSLTVPAVEFDISGTHVELWKEIDIDFSFMQSQVFSVLYGMYKVALYLIFGILEVNYARKVYERMMQN